MPGCPIACARLHPGAHGTLRADTSPTSMSKSDNPSLVAVVALVGPHYAQSVCYNTKHTAQGTPRTHPLAAPWRMLPKHTLVIPPSRLRRTLVRPS